MKNALRGRVQNDPGVPRLQDLGHLICDIHEWMEGCMKCWEEQDAALEKMACVISPKSDGRSLMDVLTEEEEELAPLSASEALNDAVVEITKLRTQYNIAAGLLQVCLDNYLPFSDDNKFLSENVAAFLKTHVGYVNWVRGGESEVMPL